MRKLSIIIFLFYPSLSFSQNNEHINVFESNIQNIALKNVHYIDLSKLLSQKGIEVTDSRNGVRSVDIETDAFPHIRGNDIQKYDYTDFFNQVTGSQVLNSKSINVLFGFEYNTNKREGNDLTTNIDTIKYIKYTFTIINDSIQLSNKQLKKEYKRIFNEMTEIIQKYYGNDFSTTTNKQSQRKRWGMPRANNSTDLLLYSAESSTCKIEFINFRRY